MPASPADAATPAWPSTARPRPGQARPHGRRTAGDSAATLSARLSSARSAAVGWAFKARSPIAVGAPGWRRLAIPPRSSSSRLVQLRRPGDAARFTALADHVYRGARRRRLLLANDIAGGRYRRHGWRGRAPAPPTGRAWHAVGRRPPQRRAQRIVLVGKLARRTTAMVASPMCLSTVPPRATTISSARARNRPAMRRSSSASTVSTSSVKPHRSANSTATWRRSGVVTTASRLVGLQAAAAASSRLRWPSEATPSSRRSSAVKSSQASGHLCDWPRTPRHIDPAPGHSANPNVHRLPQNATVQCDPPSRAAPFGRQRSMPPGRLATSMNPALIRIAVAWRDWLPARHTVTIGLPSAAAARWASSPGNQGGAANSAEGTGELCRLTDIEHIHDAEVLLQPVRFDPQTPAEREVQRRPMGSGGTSVSLPGWPQRRFAGTARRSSWDAAGRDSSCSRHSHPSPTSRRARIEALLLGDAGHGEAAVIVRRIEQAALGNEKMRDRTAR